MEKSSPQRRGVRGQRHLPGSPLIGMGDLLEDPVPYVGTANLRLAHTDRIYPQRTAHGRTRTSAATGTLRLPQRSDRVPLQTNPSRQFQIAHYSARRFRRFPATYLPLLRCATEYRFRFSQFRLFLLVLACSVVGRSASAQKSVRDSSISMTMIGAIVGVQSPGGDLSDRFGTNFNIGGTFQYKTRTNFLFGVDGYFLFGPDVKDEGLLRYFLNSSGAITGLDGQFANILLYERGMKFDLKAGRIFPGNWSEPQLRHHPDIGSRLDPTQDSHRQQIGSHSGVERRLPERV